MVIGLSNWVVIFNIDDWVNHQSLGLEIERKWYEFSYLKGVINRKSFNNVRKMHWTTYGLLLLIRIIVLNY